MTSDKDIAYLSSRWAWLRPRILHIQTVLGPKNAEADRATWIAALRWFNAHDPSVLFPEANEREKVRTVDQATWVGLWRPYWIAKRALPDWLPLKPSSKTIDMLQWE